MAHQGPPQDDNNLDAGTLGLLVAAIGSILENLQASEEKYFIPDRLEKAIANYENVRNALMLMDNGKVKHRKKPLCDLWQARWQASWSGLDRSKDIERLHEVIIEQLIGGKTTQPTNQLPEKLQLNHCAVYRYILNEFYNASVLALAKLSVIIGKEAFQRVSGTLIELNLSLNQLELTGKPSIDGEQIRMTASTWYTALLKKPLTIFKHSDNRKYPVLQNLDDYRKEMIKVKIALRTIRQSVAPDISSNDRLTFHVDPKTLKIHLKSINNEANEVLELLDKHLVEYEKNRRAKDPSSAQKRKGSEGAEDDPKAKKPKNTDPLPFKKGTPGNPAEPRHDNADNGLSGSTT